MSEGLQTLEGAPVEVSTEQVNQDFAKAMSAPPAEELAAPPKKEAQPAKKPATRRRSPATKARVVAPAPTPGPELDKQRASGIQGLVQMAAGLCLVADQRTPAEDISYRADALTLASSAEAIGNAVVETCKSSAQFAAVVDKVTKAGPYAALVSVVFSVGAQIARNHGVQAAEMMGAVAPEVLLSQLEEAPNGDAA